MRQRLSPQNHAEEALRQFDALPIDCVHLTAVFGSNELPTSRLPNLFVDALNAEVQKAIVLVDVSHVMKKTLAHGATDIKLSVER